MLNDSSSLGCSHRKQEPGPTNTPASSCLKGNYQPYPSPPKAYSYEYAGNRLRGLNTLQNAGLQHTGQS